MSDEETFEEPESGTPWDGDRPEDEDRAKFDAYAGADASSEDETGTFEDLGVDEAADPDSGQGDLMDDLVDDAAEALLGPMEDFAPPGDYPQNWTLLFCCVGLFVGAVFLPIEGKVLDLYAKDSIAGGFLTVLAAYGILACYANIYHRKMIMWPVLFAMFDGFYVAIRRLIQLIGQLPEAAGRDDYIRLAGPGLWVILFCSLMVLWTLFSGVRAGAKRDKVRKESAKAARKTGRSV